MITGLPFCFFKGGLKRNQVWAKARKDKKTAARENLTHFVEQQQHMVVDIAELRMPLAGQQVDTEAENMQLPRDTEVEHNQTDTAADKEVEVEQRAQYT